MKPRLSITFCGTLKCCIKLVPPHRGTWTKKRWPSIGTSLPWVDFINQGILKGSIMITLLCLLAWILDRLYQAGHPQRHMSTLYACFLLVLGSWIGFWIFGSSYFGDRVLWRHGNWHSYTPTSAEKSLLTTLTSIKSTQVPANNHHVAWWFHLERRMTKKNVGKVMVASLRLSSPQIKGTITSNDYFMDTCKKLYNIQ